MERTPLRIALVGFGNIGTGVVRHLGRLGAMIDGRLPRPLVLKWICDSDIVRDRGVDVRGAKLTDDFGQVLADPEVEIVIELIGGTGAARDVVTRALRAGKHVVTANKALVSSHGTDLFALAAEHDVQLLFEASVGSGIPLFASLQRGLAPNRVLAIHGIVNGTCNFILSAMEDDPETPFEVHLKEAQRLGFAEANPTLDIEGHDSAHKIAILASLAFGMDLRFEHVVREGITAVAAEDFRWARKERYAVKLLAEATLDRAGAASVSAVPCLVPAAHPLAGVRGVQNGFWIECDPLGPVMLFGPGAGPDATSSGVVSDVMHLCEAGSAQAAARLNPLRIPAGQRKLGVPGGSRRHYLRVRHPKSGLESRHLASIVGGEQVAKGSGWTTYLCPRAPELVFQETLGRLADLGILETDICHMRLAFDP